MVDLKLSEMKCKNCRYYRKYVHIRNQSVFDGVCLLNNTIAPIDKHNQCFAWDLKQEENNDE